MGGRYVSLNPGNDNNVVQRRFHAPRIMWEMGFRMVWARLVLVEKPFEMRLSVIGDW